jgi:hypothetical protein
MPYRKFPDERHNAGEWKVMNTETKTITNESIIEKTHPTDPHPPPNLPIEGGGS